MKDTEFVVNAFRKGMTENEMHGFAVMIKDQYDEGFAHHEGFDAGDLAIVVMKRDVDVEACSAPDTQALAQTLNTALQQANQTIEYLRNEGAVLRQQLADKMPVEDAKTLANVAYNRAKHLPCEDCTQQDFETWWTEYRKENGVVNEQPEPYYPESIEDVWQKLKGMANEYMLWGQLKKYNVRLNDGGMQKFNTAIHEELGFSMRSQYHKDSEAKITEGITRADYLYWMASQIYTQLTTVKKPEPTPAESVFEGIMSELKDIARGAMGWSDFENAPTPDGNFDAFWTALEKRYDSVPSGESIYIKGTQFEYLDSIAKAIIVLNPKKFEVKPKADAITADEVLPRIKALAMRFFGWAHEWMQWIVSEQDKSIQLFHTLVADEYELELDIEATNKGLRLFEITRMQYLEKVAQAVADALNK